MKWRGDSRCGVLLVLSLHRRYIAVSLMTVLKKYRHDIVTNRRCVRFLWVDTVVLTMFYTMVGVWFMGLFFKSVLRINAI